MNDNYKKQVTNILSIGILIFAFCIIGIIVLSKEMAKTASKVEEIRIQSLTNQAFLKSYNALTEQKKNLAVDSDSLNGLLPSPDDLITVQDRIQNLGKSLQVATTINFEILNPASGNEPANQSFTLNLNGTLPNISQFLKSLSDLPYFIKFDSFNIDEQVDGVYQPVVTDKKGTPIPTLPPPSTYIMNANGEIYVNDQDEK